VFDLGGGGAYQIKSDDEPTFLPPPALDALLQELAFTLWGWLAGWLGCQDIHWDKKSLAFTSFTHVLLLCLPLLDLLAKAWLDAEQDCVDPPTRVF